MRLMPTMLMASCWRTHLAGGGAGLVLEAEAHPAVAVVVTLVGFRDDGIGEDKKGGVGAAFGGEAFDEQLVFVGKHGVEPFLGYVARGFAVDGAAESPVEGRHGFGGGAGGAAGLKKHAGDLLAGADLGEYSVAGGVEVDGEGLTVGREQLIPGLHGHGNFASGWDGAIFVCAGRVTILHGKARRRWAGKQR